MAARNYTQRKKPTVEAPKRTCGECANSYDFHEIGADGKPFLCRCPYYTNGRFCRFIDEKQCNEHFKLRENGKTE